jgi:hypothetical protein
MYAGITPSVDPQFKKELKRFDPNLDIEFRRDYGTFVITQPSKLSGRVPAMVIAPETHEKSEGRTWRQPNMRDIGALHRADFARRSMKQQVTEGEDRIFTQQRKDKEFAQDEIKARTREDRIQIMNTFNRACNTGKGRTGVRQIIPKSKGYKVEDRRKLQTDNG